MDILENEKIADLSRRWVAAEAERKQRKREFGYAMVLLKKVGEERLQQPDGGDALWERLDGVPQERFAFFLALMRDAYKRRQASASTAGSLRGALNRACRGKAPEPHAEIMERYDELCAQEQSDSDREEASVLQG